MPIVTLENVLHVVDFEPNGKGRRRGMATEKAMSEFRAVTELNLPVHDACGLKTIALDDFGMIVRGAWWIVLQMACESPRRGYLLRYAGDGRIEPLRPRHIGERLRMRPERVEEILEQLGPGRAGVLETVRRYEMEIDDAERGAYESHRQGELFAPAARDDGPPPAAMNAAAAIDRDLAKFFEEEWLAGKRKPLEAEAVAMIAEALGPHCRGGRPSTDDLLQWGTMVVRCMTIPRRGAPGAAPLPAEIAVRIAGVVGQARELAAECAVRGKSRNSIRNAPAVLAAWARERGLLRGARKGA